MAYLVRHECDTARGGRKELRQRGGQSIVPMDLPDAVRAKDETNTTARLDPASNLLGQGLPERQRQKGQTTGNNLTITMSSSWRARW